MRYVAGIDSGSGFTKAVVIRQNQADRPPVVLGHAGMRTGVNIDESARCTLDAAMKQARVHPSEVYYVAATGVGR